jgi:hypothetical protein
MNIEMILQASKETGLEVIIDKNVYTIYACVCVCVCLCTCMLALMCVHVCECDTKSKISDKVTSLLKIFQNVSIWETY